MANAARNISLESELRHCIRAKQPSALNSALIAMRLLGNSSSARSDGTERIAGDKRNSHISFAKRRRIRTSCRANHNFDFDVFLVACFLASSLKHQFYVSHLNAIAHSAIAMRRREQADKEALCAANRKPNCRMQGLKNKNGMSRVRDERGTNERTNGGAK